MEKQKHMDINTRSTLQAELDKGTSFKEIGRILGKDCTTVSKEVRKHLVFEQTGYDHSCSARLVCGTCMNKRRFCWSCGKCIEVCDRYEPYVCKALTRAPYVCNACKQKSKCTLEKAFYRASSAQREYETLRKESRSGFAVSEAELANINSIVSPLLRKGQSLHHICANHADELMVTRKSQPP